jgi:hypothetical protein
MFFLLCRRKCSSFISTLRLELSQLNPSEICEHSSTDRQHFLQTFEKQLTKKCQNDRSVFRCPFFQLWLGKLIWLYLSLFCSVLLGNVLVSILKWATIPPTPLLVIILHSQSYMIGRLKIINSAQHHFLLWFALCTGDALTPIRFL